MLVNIYIDGGTYKNRICVSDGIKKEFFVERQEKEHTNNQLEYLALSWAAKYYALNYQEGPPVIIWSDSQLIVRQVNGKYQVKNHLLKPYYQQAMDDLEKAHIPVRCVQWLPRDQNYAGIYLEKLKDAEQKKRQ